MGIFQVILGEFKEIKTRLDRIEARLAREPMQLDMHESLLLKLPDHLRRTYIVVANRGKCVAEDVAAMTGRSRAHESDYLNQLSTMGFLSKGRVCREVEFRLREVEKVG